MGGPGLGSALGSDMAPGSVPSGHLPQGRHRDSETAPAFSAYWLNDEGIKKKKSLILSCLDTPEGDTVVRKAGLLGPWGPKFGPIG